MPISSARSKTTRSTQVGNGRYVQGGSTEQYENRIGWWERKVFSRSSDDIGYTITPRTAQRPDLIAYEIYKSAKLQWFVLQYNNIVDLTTELKAGTRIVLPTPERLQATMLTSSTGGVRA